MKSHDVIRTIIEGVTVALFALGGLIFGGCIVLYIFYIIFLSDPGPITKNESYDKMLRKIPEMAGSHFPKTIPSDPNRVRIYYYDTSHIIGQGGWGQGELWLRLERSEIDKIYADFEKQTKPSNVPTDLHEFKPRKFHSVSYDAKTSETLITPPPLPSDFMIFRLKDDERRGWFRGAAISKQRGEIIYYAGYSYSM